MIRNVSPARKRMAVWALIAVTAAGVKLASVVTAAPATVSGIILLVGANETERVVNWYASSDSAQYVQIAPTKQVQRGEFPSGAVQFAAVVAANTANAAVAPFNGHAVLHDLDENTAYSYRVGAQGAWSQTYAFKTRKFDGNFDFLFFGDPQIGASSNVGKDQAGWEDTLNVALAANPETELLVSGGDQVETAGTETQWTAFLAPKQLRSFPWVATIGNHDVGSKAYEQHLWTPNTNRSNSLYTGPLATVGNRSGGDYWFIFKNVLFIDLNSNAYATTAEAGVNADQAHLNFVSSVIQQHGAGMKYTVLIYHHSIYSPADHANDGDNAIRRQDFPQAFSNLGVDLVLQGHDHSYSRSYLIASGLKQNTAERPGAGSVFQQVGGVVYVTGNSASGSKYYDLSVPGGNFPADPLDPSRHWANSVENQEHVRSYVKVSVRKEHLEIQNIRSGTCAAPNAAVELGRVDWCGPNDGASPAQPVGSVVDQVVMHSVRR